jgi:hypothetical protein
MFSKWFDSMVKEKPEQLFQVEIRYEGNEWSLYPFRSLPEEKALRYLGLFVDGKNNGEPVTLHDESGTKVIGVYDTSKILFMRILPCDE